MEIGLIEIGLTQLLARKFAITEIKLTKLRRSIVNIQHKSGTTKKTQKRIKTWYKIQIGT